MKGIMMSIAEKGMNVVKVMVVMAYRNITQGKERLYFKGAGYGKTEK
ncbi:MAG: hypothetical protein JJE30_16925 [Desulfuromonadales bacterium]|nr:hypothetical protein [Desulfuromonadales bacterium]